MSSICFSRYLCFYSDETMPCPRNKLAVGELHNHTHCLTKQRQSYSESAVWSSCTMVYLYDFNKASLWLTLIYWFVEITRAFCGYASKQCLILFSVSSIICVAFSSTPVTSYCSECVSCWIYCYFLENLITWKHSSRLFVMLYKRLLPDILLNSKHCAKNTLLCYTVLHASEI